MKGNIIGFDPDTNTGAINGQDGARYDFATMDWLGRGKPEHGDAVEFTPERGRATLILLLAPAYARPGFGRFYFSPHGRIARSQYWLRYFLPVFGIIVILRLAAVVHGEAPREGAFITLLNLFYLLALWPSIAILVKRIHDRDRSGWLVLLFYVPVSIGIAIGAVAVNAVETGHIHNGNQLAILGAIVLGGAALVGIWFFIEFGCMPGTGGVNQYGADPLGPQR